MNISEEIKRLHELHQSGALTDEEFAQAKTKILSSPSSDQTQQSVKGDFISELNHLRRSNSDRWLGGVCGGLASVTGLDSWVWRLIFVLLNFCFGSGLLFYLLAWIFVPIEE